MQRRLAAPIQTEAIYKLICCPEAEGAIRLSPRLNRAPAFPVVVQRRLVGMSINNEKILIKTSGSF
jgi:hypothetical protein